MDDPKAAVEAVRKALGTANTFNPYVGIEPDFLRTLLAYIARLERKQGEVVGTLHVGTIGARIIPPNGEPMKVGDWLDRAAPDFYKIATIPEQSDD